MPPCPHVSHGTATTHQCRGPTVLSNTQQQHATAPLFHSFHPRCCSRHQQAASLPRAARARTSERSFCGCLSARLPLIRETLCSAAAATRARGFKIAESVTKRVRQCQCVRLQRALQCLDNFTPGSGSHERDLAPPPSSIVERVFSTLQQPLHVTRHTSHVTRHT